MDDDNPIWAIVLIALIFAFMVLTVPSSAANNITILNQTTEPTTIATIVPQITEGPRVNPYSYHVIGRIAQGQKVHVNDTIDISGMGINMEGVAWYGKYSEYEEPQYIRKFTAYPIDRYDFWLDPAIFDERPGIWYQYYGNTSTESHGNTVAFEVISSQSPQNVPGNELLTNETRNITPPVPIAHILPDVHVSDYLLAIGDPLRIETVGAAKIWIFGRVNKLYDVEVKGINATNISFPSESFDDFEPGHYKILVQQKGHNGQFDVRYMNTSIQYLDSWNGIKSEDLDGIQPMLAIDRLKAMIAKTDDTEAVYDLEIQRPSITINSMQETSLGDRGAEFYGQTGLVTLMHVRGYTNIATGSTVPVVLDKSNKIPHDILITTQNTTVVRYNDGDMGVYEVGVPLIWDDLAVTTTADKMHVITASGPFGIWANANLPVRNTESSPLHNTTYKYLGEENPFHENMTTVTVTVPILVPGPTQIVTIVFTPSPEEIDAKAQEKWDATAEFWFKVGGIIVIVIILAAFSWWVVSAYRRSK